MAKLCCQMMHRPLHLQKMCNLLWEELPDYVVISDVKYPVWTSFKNWVQILILAEEKGFSDGHAVAKMLKLCYKEKLPKNIVSAILGIIAFLNGDTEFSVSSGKKSAQKVFSFNQDASVIYSTFYEKYGIDLSDTDMHWYKFCALFENLADDNPFRTLIRIRTMDDNEIKNSKVSRQVRELKSKYSLKNKTEVDVAEGLACLF